MKKSFTKKSASIVGAIVLASSSMLVGFSSVPSAMAVVGATAPEASLEDGERVTAPMQVIQWIASTQATSSFVNLDDSKGMDETLYRAELFNFKCGDIVKLEVPYTIASYGEKPGEEKKTLIAYVLLGTDGCEILDAIKSDDDFTDEEVAKIYETYGVDEDSVGDVKKYDAEVLLPIDSINEPSVISIDHAASKVTSILHGNEELKVLDNTEAGFLCYYTVEYERIDVADADVDVAVKVKITPFDDKLFTKSTVTLYKEDAEATDLEKDVTIKVEGEVKDGSWEGTITVLGSFKEDMRGYSLFIDCPTMLTSPSVELADGGVLGEGLYTGGIEQMIPMAALLGDIEMPPALTYTPEQVPAETPAPQIAATGDASPAPIAAGILAAAAAAGAIHASRRRNQ